MTDLLIPVDLDRYVEALVCPDVSAVLFRKLLQGNFSLAGWRELGLPEVTLIEWLRHGWVAPIDLRWGMAFYQLTLDGRDMLESGVDLGFNLVAPTPRRSLRPRMGWLWKRGKR